jgi:cytochrome c oxidase assembly protein subunit 15
MAQRPVGQWLLLCAAMIFVMAVIGAATRLTESGLSIVDWKPVHGVIPPLSHSEWLEEFDRYRQYPEYQKINRGMSLAAFKQIFWWEYVHRLWGRLIGIVFAVPLVWFCVRGQVRGRLAIRLAGLLLLGGLQGAIGWWMVKSGLVDRPDVSHYRLAVHLMMAAILFALCLAQGLALLGVSARQGTAATARLAWLLLGCVLLTMTWGAFVAGLNAGLVYNTFPLMEGGVLPPDWQQTLPWWRNVLEQHGVVQWVHRLLALLTLTLACVYVARVRRVAALSQLAWVLLAALLVQVTLGVMTLLWMVPILLGVLHQANGFIVLAVLVANLRLARTAVPSAVPAPVAARRAGADDQGQNTLGLGQTDGAAG